MKGDVHSPPSGPYGLRDSIRSIDATEGENRFSRGAWFAIAVVTALLLSPMLFFPLGHDEAIFFVSGQKILEGSLPYRDFVDIKPPLIYYLYAIAIALFGDGDGSIRILDFLMQGGTIWLMVALIRRASGSDWWGAIAALVYAVVYVGLSPAGTAQTESYVGLFAFAMLWLQLSRRTTWGFVAIGILGGLLVLFKVTFGVVLVGSLLAELIVLRSDNPWKPIGLILAGLAATGLVFLLWLLSFDLMTDFRLMQDYTSGYVAQQWSSIGGWLKDFSKKAPPYLADNYSIVLSLLTVVGMGASLLGWRPASVRQDRSDDTLRLLKFCTITLLLLFTTIAIEQKYAAYHFGRFYPFGVVLGSYGLLLSVASVRRSEGVSPGYRLFIGAAVAVMILLFSPLTRYLWHSGAAVVKLTKGSTGLDSYYDQSVIGYTRTEMKRIADEVHRRRSDGDRTFVASGFGGLMYRFLDEVPDFKLYHATTFTATFAPAQWKQQTSEYLRAARPRFIVAQFNDGYEAFNGTPMSSEEGLRALEGIDGMMDEEYREVIRTEGFVLYERMR